MGIFGRYKEWQIQFRLRICTSNYHYHEVHADSEETLDMIENMLREKGYLVED